MAKASIDSFIHPNRFPFHFRWVKVKFVFPLPFLSISNDSLRPCAMHIHRAVGLDPYTFRCGDRLLLLLGLDKEEKPSLPTSSPAHTHATQPRLRQKNVFYSSNRGTVDAFGVDFCGELRGNGLESSEYTAAAQFVGFIRRTSEHRKERSHIEDLEKDACGELGVREECGLKRNVSFLAGSKISSVVDEDLMHIVDEGMVDDFNNNNDYCWRGKKGEKCVWG